MTEFQFLKHKAKIVEFTKGGRQNIVFTKATQSSEATLNRCASQALITKMEIKTASWT
jgi:hypothetical protein